MIGTTGYYLGKINIKGYTRHLCKSFIDGIFSEAIASMVVTALEIK
jgi:hypothetical protein